MKQARQRCVAHRLRSKACFIASGEAKQKMPEAMKQEKSKTFKPPKL
jgi:hypothetical protein